MRELRRSGVGAVVAAMVPLLAGCGERAGPGAPRVESDSTERAALASDFHAPVDVARLLGIRFPPYPGGVEQLAAAVIVRPYARVPDDPWGFESVRVGTRPMLWLSRVVERHVEPMMEGGRQVGTSSTPTFRLEDALPLPPMGAEERLELFACRGPDGLNVASVGRWDDRRKTLGDVRVAWRHDPLTGRLAEVDPRTVRCRNEAVGPP